MSNINLFKSFAPKQESKFETGVNTVIYTRVSHQSQEDNTKGGDSSITVINTTVIASPSDIPLEPEILKGII